jgi:transcriptional regulator with XRE-family HTH domain
MTQIGKNIRMLRQKQGWTQGEVARRLKLSTPAFSKIETSISDISLSRLNQIAELFNTTILEILLEPGEDMERLHAQELKKYKLMLAERDHDVIKLQAKLISLYDELRKANV